MNTATIAFADGIWSIASNEDVRKITLDEHTGDWAVVNPLSDFPQPTYLQTRDGAFDYAFEELGVVDDGDYDHAPDRTSA